MSAPNPLRRLTDRLLGYPAWICYPLLTWIFGAKVKFFRTAGIRITHLSDRSATMVLPNKTKVQNHIGSVHAAAMALLGESVTGLIFGLNLPGDKLPLIKSMQLSYTRRATGQMTAVAELDEIHLKTMQADDKGEVPVRVRITDGEGKQTLDCEMRWAWISKAR